MTLQPSREVVAWYKQQVAESHSRRPRVGEDPRYRTAPHSCLEKSGYVYILTNQPNGILYVGVTSNLNRRMYEHREGIYEGFSKRYNLKTLVYYEEFESIAQAIAREKQLKHFNRAWKVGLILQTNSMWEDLYEHVCS